MVYTDGAKYVGHFDDGDRHGEGTYYGADGIVYKGTWWHDIFYSGQETHKNANGTNLTWKYEDGRVVSGEGTDVCVDGTKYVGVWSYIGDRSGGDITWPDGRTYKGQWRVIHGKPDVPEGDGEMTWPDGKKYTGDFRDGLPHGLGKMVLSNGEIQNGLWKKGQFVGTYMPSPTTLPQGG